MPPFLLGPEQLLIKGCQAGFALPRASREEQKGRSQHHVYLLFIAVSGNTITARQAESKQFSKNMNQLGPLKASFYGVIIRTPLGQL